MKSRLLRAQDGKMCCLGFYMKKCGLTDEQIKGIPDPISLSQNMQIPKKAHWLIGNGGYKNSKDAMRLMDINDNLESLEEYKEKSITKIFSKHDVQVKFIN